MTLVGLGWAACYLGATAVVADLTTAEERGTALGASDLFTSLRRRRPASSRAASCSSPPASASSASSWPA